VEQGEPASVAVTSPQSGDGKTTLATNLAAAWALAGLRTVLVSADVRAPTIHRELFGSDEQAMRKPTHGLAELLLDVEADVTAPAVVDGALLYTKVENLRWLPATLTTPLPTTSATRVAELLSSARARQLLTTLAGIADVFVVDTPPAPLSEAASLCGLVDGVVLVVRPNRTLRSSLRRTVQAWEGTPITAFGVVLNGVHLANEAYLVSGSVSSRRSRKERQEDEVAWRETPPLRVVSNGNGSGRSAVETGNAESSEAP
jgi:capsular exopolysaccharide synthesis family protein